MEVKFYHINYEKTFFCVIFFLLLMFSKGFSQTASFSMDVTSGCGPLCVNFSDQSTNPVSWFWDFGDASTSSLQNPMHCYVTPGNYTITLTVTFGSSTGTASGNVTVYPNPIAAFSAANIGNNTVNFSDQSTGGITAWSWDFGDSTFSNLQNPSHVYASPGIDTICLVVISATGCSDSICQIFTITGLTENNSSTSWNIFPNPSQGQISIHFDAALENAKILRIENMLGEIIFQKEISSDAIIDLSDQSTGIYFVRMGNSAPQKLVIE